MHLMPKSLMAHGACSRELPQPKLSPATKIEVPFHSGLFKTKSGFSEPSALNRISKSGNAQSGSFDGFQKLLRDNHVRVDVLQVHRSGFTFERRKRRHTTTTAARFRLVHSRSRRHDGLVCQKVLVDFLRDVVASQTGTRTDFSDIAQLTSNGRGSSHGWRHQVRSAAVPLTTFKVSV